MTNIVPGTTTGSQAAILINDAFTNIGALTSVVGAAASVSGTIGTSIDTDGTLKSGAVDVAGIIANGIITNDKLATDAKVGSLATLTTATQNDVVSSVNEINLYMGESLLSVPQNDLLSVGTTLEGFESTAEWTVHRGTLTDDTTEFRTGTQSIKFISASGSSAYATKTISESFGSTGPSRLRLSFYAYSSGSAFNASTAITVYLSSDTSFTKAFTYTKSNARLHLGWNTIDIYPEDWVNIGSESWSNTMVRMRVGLWPPADGSVVEGSFDELCLNPTMQSGVMMIAYGNYSSIYSEAYSYMKTKRLRMTVYPNPLVINAVGNTTAEQLREMDANGWDIGFMPHNGSVLTSHSYAEIVGFFNDARTLMSGSGLSRSSMHTVYPSGLSNDTVILAAQDTGIITGVNILSSATCYPCAVSDQTYNIVSGPTLANTVSLAQAKAIVDSAYTSGRIATFNLFDILASSGTYAWAISDFRALIDYIESLNMPFLTIWDMYRLQSGTINVPLSSLTTTAKTLSAAINEVNTELVNSQKIAITNVTSAYGVLPADELVRCDGTFDVSLPAATGTGKPYRFKNKGTGTITIVPNGSDTIDGDSNYTLTTQNSAITLVDAAIGIWET